MKSTETLVWISKIERSTVISVRYEARNNICGLISVCSWENKTIKENIGVLSLQENYIIIVKDKLWCMWCWS